MALQGDFELPADPGVLVRSTKDVAKLQKLIHEDSKPFASTRRTINPLPIMCQGWRTSDARVIGGMYA